jgi:hypothetical protein
VEKKPCRTCRSCRTNKTHHRSRYCINATVSINFDPSLNPDMATVIRDTVLIVNTPPLYLRRQLTTTHQQQAMAVLHLEADW